MGLRTGAILLEFHGCAGGRGGGPREIVEIGAFIAAEIPEMRVLAIRHQDQVLRGGNIHTRACAGPETVGLIWLSGPLCRGEILPATAPLVTLTLLRGGIAARIAREATTTGDEGSIDRKYSLRAARRSSDSRTLPPAIRL